MNDIYSLFRQQVLVCKDKIAIQNGNKTMSYNELQDSVSHISVKLIEKGICKQDIVAIYMKNSIETVVAMLAVLNIGAVCLPIDIRSPEMRVMQIITHSNAKSLLYSEIPVKSLPADQQIFITLENTFTHETLSQHNCTIYGHDPAFCIYTSGSTGNPKGVMLSHSGIINHMEAKRTLLYINESSILCQSFSIGFVATIWQILTPLTTGAKLVIYNEDILQNAYTLFQRIEKDSVEVVSLIPQFLLAYLMLIQGGMKKIELKNLKYIILTGEKVDPEIVNMFYQLYAIQLINAYGQSECSDDTLHYVIQRKTNYEEIPIGKPINNVWLYILDEEMSRVQQGQKGELCIFGQCLAIGYLNDTEMTQKKFVPNPFAQNQKIYKTGDFVKELDDGNLLYIGRVDNQVKIRGHRIELEEIEAVINQFKGISQSIVKVTVINESDKMLEAFYISDVDLNIVQIKDYLSQKLPMYMIPSKFTRIKEFIYTQNGKVDRNRLGKNILITRNKKSKLLSDFSEIQRQAFEVIKSNLDEKFTIDLHCGTDLSSVGVDSITFIKIIVALENVFEIEFDVDMLLFTAFPTIQSLIEYVESKKLEKI
ncbi:MAG: non-ribosomal peptide synthetase [Clostridia bacterium]|nr:non-ribosomal peptide synthetase [Clostridia bacterium]